MNLKRLLRAGQTKDGWGNYRTGAEFAIAELWTFAENESREVLTALCLSYHAQCYAAELLPMIESAQAAFDAAQAEFDAAWQTHRAAKAAGDAATGLQHDAAWRTERVARAALDRRARALETARNQLADMRGLYDALLALEYQADVPWLR